MQKMFYRTNISIKIPRAWRLPNI